MRPVKQTCWKIGFVAYVITFSCFLCGCRRSMLADSFVPPGVVHEQQVTDNIRTGSFELKVNLPYNTTVKVYYRIPVDKNGMPGPNAHNIIFYAPFIHESNFFTRDFHTRFTDEFGFSIYSFEIQLNQKDQTNRLHHYYYPESGWPKPIFDVQDFLIQKYDLKRTKLLVLGESGGGSMGQMLGIHYGDRIDAVAIVGGRFFDMPKVKSPVAWLSLSTWQDPGEASNVDFQKQAQKMGIQVLHVQTPPDWGRVNNHHSPGDEALTSLQEFLMAVVRLRDQHGGSVPSAEKWPVTSVDGTGAKVHLPDVCFQSQWEQINAHPKFSYGLAQTEEFTPVIVEPARDRPKGVVLWLQDEECPSPLQDNLFYYASQGGIGVGASISNNDLTALKQVEQLLCWAGGRWEKSALVVAGYGIGGQLAMVATAKCCSPTYQVIPMDAPRDGKTPPPFVSKPPNVSKIVAISSPTYWPVEALSPKAFVDQSKTKLTLVYGVKDIELNTLTKCPNDMKSAVGGCIIQLIPGVNAGLGQSWFRVLQDEIVK